MSRFQNKEEERDFFNRQGKSGSTAYEPLLTQVTEQIRAEIQKNLSPGKRVRILEAGCGSGAYGRRLCQQGYEVVGADISPEVLPLTQTSGYTAIAGDLEGALFAAESFEAIVSIGFLHHFPDLSKTQIISNFVFWLKDGGMIFALEPNGKNIVSICSKVLGKLYLKFKPDNPYLTSNERNHTLGEYKKAFFLKEFELVSSMPVCESGPDTYSGFMHLLVKIRRVLQKLNDMLLPFPYKGWGVFVIFRKV